MKKTIAIITGASGGIGSEFVKEMMKENLDEIWVIARNYPKLQALKDKFGEKIIPISMDLTNISDIKGLEERLRGNNQRIKYLVNNAGVARMATYKEFSLEEIQSTLLLNCGAMVSMSTICIPHMVKGSVIFNISSASAFQPLPYLNIYASTKAFERNYSRSLNVELKSTGILSIAVCPSWVDTELLMKEINGKKVKFDGIVSANRVVKLAIKDAKAGKDMSVCSAYVKWMHVLIKLTPQKITMNVWMRKIGKYLK